jgi:hypothetical protein
MSDFISMIDGVGFPIAMVIYFIWDKNNTTKTLVTAINNNTKIITRLMNRINCADLYEEGGEDV